MSRLADWVHEQVLAGEITAEDAADELLGAADDEAQRLKEW